MKLSTTALQILNNPMDYLDMDHQEKKPMNPSRIWRVKLPECGEQDFINALNLIRQIASKKGRGFKEVKAVVHNSIESYVDQVWDRFRNVNQLNFQVKGLFGCELPKHLRERNLVRYANQKVRSRYNRYLNDDASTPTQTTVEAPIDAPVTTSETTSPLTFTFNGVSITLSSGASLNIGELETKTLDFKGLKSVSIERVEGGKLYGVSLEA